MNKTGLDKQIDKYQKQYIRLINRLHEIELTLKSLFNERFRDKRK